MAKSQKSNTGKHSIGGKSKSISKSTGGKKSQPSGSAVQKSTSGQGSIVSRGESDSLLFTAMLSSSVSKSKAVKSRQSAPAIEISAIARDPSSQPSGAKQSTQSQKEESTKEDITIETGLDYDCHREDSVQFVQSVPLANVTKQPLLKGSDEKKIATGGINKFDPDIAKEIQGKTAEPVDVAKDRRATRNRKGTDSNESQTDLLYPGAGILERAQLVKRTRFNCSVQVALMTSLNTVKDQEAIRSKLRSNKMKIILDEPFNLLSTITDLLGLTGAGGIIKERFEQFPRQIGCVINVTNEVPLLKVNGIESYRIPVEDDPKEDLSIYFDEVIAKMHSFRSKGLATVVHCMAGVSRSATIVLAYLIRHHKMSLEEAFRLTKTSRSMINPNLGFLVQLAQFEGANRPAKECSRWRDHTENDITKRLPEFIISDFLDDYQIEFDKK